MSDTGSIVWFRRDLRLTDQPALVAASRRGEPVIPIFIWSPEEEGKWPDGAASRWWLHQSLARLSAALVARGSRLIIRRGPARRTIFELLKETGASCVHWNRRYEPAARVIDGQVQAALRRAGDAHNVTNGSLLFEPEETATKDGRPYQVFTAFWRNCLARPAPQPPLAAPKTLRSPKRWPKSLALDALDLEPTLDWAADFREHWTPGEEGAQSRLKRFLKSAVDEYSSGRDELASDGTSALSPHLHFGEISPRQVWRALDSRRPRSSSRRRTESIARFRAELGWREFAHHLLYHFPLTPEKPLRERFAAFPWAKDRAGLRAWERGQTGFPVVDAGMRQLWWIGWMHNRARMIVASFLVKDLLISCTEGARWFWDTLVDADLANNTLGWQWTAGCGADAAPYFRVFNPVSQGEKFDPDGEYVRRWVPELIDLPNRWIHKPWEAPQEVLAKAGVTLGETYPRPIIDHGAARRRALAAIKRRT